jgi:hypothetical protein
MVEADLSVTRYVAHEAMDALDRIQGVTQTRGYQRIVGASTCCTPTDGAWVAELNGVAIGCSMRSCAATSGTCRSCSSSPISTASIGRELLRRAQANGHLSEARGYSQ